MTIRNLTHIHIHIWKRFGTSPKVSKKCLEKHEVKQGNVVHRNGITSSCDFFQSSWYGPWLFGNNAITIAWRRRVIMKQQITIPNNRRYLRLSNGDNSGNWKKQNNLSKPLLQKFQGPHKQEIKFPWIGAVLTRNDLMKWTYLSFRKLTCQL